MTKKFKFGDLVQHENKDFYPEIGVIVGMNTEHNEAKVYFEGFHNPEFVKANELVAVAQPETLEIVPHPDTVRLDWLADKHNKIGSVLLPRECVEKHLDNMRDAIDAAMQLPTDN